VLSALDTIDTGFYVSFSEAKKNRMASRYLENSIKGNPIDLYPSNKITFSYDKAGNFINSKDWGKSSFGFGLSHSFADSGLNRT
ncbi:hypothetical protein, partial [Bacillus cereus group sp. BC330]|uniref:hypothetical protein n=1 Tax=Bacillus cereus group sp. BC330 TaxID=3445306 RepID=UPI003F258D0C